MDYDESSDILGGRLYAAPQSSSAWSDPGQITLLLGLGLAAFYTWARLAPHYRQWREIRYKKATRRRYGILDDDNRPFNVAYAAALQAKKQREGRGNRPHMRAQPVLGGEEEEMAFVDAPRLIVPSFVKSVGYGNGHLPLSRNAETSQSTLGSRPDVSNVHSASQQECIPQTLPHSLPNVSAARKPRPSGVKQPLVARISYGKHALDDETDSEPEMLAKKSRVEGEELVDGDEEAEWHGSDEDMEVDESQPMKRGSKRVASSEDDEGLDHPWTFRRDKRARKVSLDKSPLSPDEGIGEDIEDGGEDVEDVVRGKKRDRVEAGSTFGGDDSLTDDECEKRKRRRRKGRVSHKLEAGLSRGQKRGRGSQSPESDESECELPRHRATRKKRGRRSQDDVIPISNDPLCKGRRIGEEWESHGVLFKVGPNGQRLRQELVKKSRSKFPMPSDSQHPDRRAHVDIYVETWLSEEEYKLAKEHRELAWQDSSPTPPGPQTPGDVAESPSKIAGKNLLWSSTIVSRESPLKRGPLKQSITTNAGSRLNIFPPPPAISTRRISSIYQAPASPAAESPKLQKTKSYSKWEKQDLEAAAMSKIRDRQQAARVANATKASTSSAPSPTPCAPISTATPPLFTAPSTGAASIKAHEKSSASAATFSFAAPSNTSSAAADKPSATELPKISTTPATVTAESSKPAAAFSFAPSAAVPSAVAMASTPTSGSAAPPTSTSIPNFFGKPAAATTTTSTPSTASSSIPNFFAKSVAQTSNPATTSTSASAPASEVSKPAFSFGVPPAQQTTTSTVFPPGNATNDPTKNTNQAKTTPGTSLLSRIGMGPPPSSQPAATPTFFAKPESTMPAATNMTDTSKTSTPPSAAAASVPKFNFGVTSKPASDLATPAFATNAAMPSAATLTAPTFTSAPASSTPKFSFGVTNSSSQPAATSSPASAFGGSTTASTTTVFSANKGPFSSGATSALASTSSPFGGASNAASPFSAAASIGTKSAEPAKSASGFGATNGATPTTSPFGAASGKVDKPVEPISFGGNITPSQTSTSGASPFGVPAVNSTSSPFGATSSNVAKPGETPKSAFSFGNTGSSASSAVPSIFGNAAQKTETQTTTKPIFGFGTSSTAAPTFGATSVPAGQGSKPTLSFGTPASTGTAAAASATPAFGSTTSGTDNKAPFSFNFGQSSNNTPAASTPAFGGFGSQPAAGSTSATSTSSPFGAPAPSAQQGSSAFAGFGAPSVGPFSFGSNSGQGQQK